jgi:hypothetical protein
MNRNFRLALAAGALIVAACGDDSGTEEDDDSRDGNSGGSTTNGDAGTKTDAKTDADSGNGGNTTAENPSSGGKCSKGEYKSDESELTLCNKVENDKSCPAMSVLAGFTEFNGDLNLNPHDDSDLDAASCLETTGLLTVNGGVEVTSLKAFSNIKSLTGLAILDNDKLTTLAGFDKLGMVLELTVNANDGLTDIKGLPKGLKVGSLYVVGNDELASLDGLVASGIQIESTLAFENNAKLSSCKVADFAKRYPDAELSNFGNLTEQCK